MRHRPTTVTRMRHVRIYREALHVNVCKDTKGMGLPASKSMSAALGLITVTLTRHVVTVLEASPVLASLGIRETGWHAAMWTSAAWVLTTAISMRHVWTVMGASSAPVRTATEEMACPAVTSMSAVQGAHT